jgi:hypothetical protein
VEEILSSSQGRISVIARDTLQELCAALRLTPEEAQDIETHAFKPYHEYEDKLKRYEQTLRKVLAQAPLSEELKKDLQYRQRDLGIKPEDVARIEQLILAEAETLHQEEAPAIPSPETECARQQDLQVHRVREETVQAGAREQREAQRDREELRAAQAETQRQQEAARAQQSERQKQRDQEAHTTPYPDSQPGPSPSLSSSKTRLRVGGSVIIIVLALAFVFFLLNRESDTEKSTEVLPPLDSPFSIATAKSIAEGATLSGSLGPGQEQHVFEFTASSSKIRVIVRIRSQDGFQGAVDVYDHNEKRIAQVHEGVSLLSGIHPQDQPITLAFESRPGELYYIMVRVLAANTRGDYELTVRKE